MTSQFATLLLLVYFNLVGEFNDLLILTEEETNQAGFSQFVF